MSIWYGGTRAEINLMPAAKKVELNFKLDPTSKLGSFIEWYGVRYRTVNENGRKRIGNAKKAIQDYLQCSLNGYEKTDNHNKGYRHFLEAIEEFKEDTKLPQELQNMKNYLSDEEFAQYKSLYEKGLKEQQKNISAAA